MGINVVTLTRGYPFGTVESYEDAKNARYSSKPMRRRSTGSLVTLPNFGDERGVADSIRFSGLDVPVLVHAFPDETGKMSVENRRDSFAEDLRL